jgi:hypothetical protein
MVKKEALLTEMRRAFHAHLLRDILTVDEKGIPSNADGDNKTSIAIATGLIERIGKPKTGKKISGQKAGSLFEETCAEFIQGTFMALNHMRPGIWFVEKGQGNRGVGIARFDQYTHLDDLERLARQNTQLAAALGSDYLIKPDIVVYRKPEPDGTINALRTIVGPNEAHLTGLRASNGKAPILHASISCKWTLRSDRAQNARSEGLNLVRNRKGRLPHVTVILGEPLPSRIASIALGTGDIDHVYHFALPELIQTVKDLNLGDAEDLLNTMIQGKRLRDISDLPLDLIV